MPPLRFSRRCGENYPYGAAYGCAITRYRRRRMPASEIALYLAAVLALIVIWSVL